MSAMGAKGTISIPLTPYGPYHATSVLGRGGMGVVYRARHQATGQEVALKTLHTMEALVLAQMRREIAALARLQHPGIVKIVEHGVQDGVPWYAMELVEGLTLGQLCKLPRFDTSTLTTAQPPASTQRVLLEAEQGHPGPAGPWWTTGLVPTSAAADAAQVSHPEPTQALEDNASLEEFTRPLDASLGSWGGFAARKAILQRLPHEHPPFPEQLARSLLTLVRRLCGPLAYLHGEGVVHRDLKPGNVLFLADGRPVLVDFGLSADQGGQSHRERLRDDFHTYGTPGYMAPEQIMGRAVDARCDLYALGCLLFKLLTGRVPFVDKDPMKVYQQHLKEPPPLLSSLYTGVPSGLQRLLDRLLAKSPHERLGHAMDVAAWLVDLGAADESLPGPQPRSYLYLSGFVGRGQVVEPLLEQLTTPVLASPLTFLEGESGIGKTRVLIELLQRAQAAGMRTFSGRCQPPAQTNEGFAAPLEALSPWRKPLRMLADTCWEHGPGETTRIFGAHRLSVLASFVSALQHVPGALYIPPEQLPVDSAYQRLLDALVQSFAAACGEQSVVIVFDDMQWADPLTVQLLSLLARESHPWLRLLVSFRREQAPAQLLALADAAGAARVVLGNLESSSIRAMLHTMLAVDEVPKALAEGVAHYAKGNPFFAAEYLRMALEQDYLSRDRQGRWQFHSALPTRDEGFSLPVPSSIQQLLMQRLEGLSDEERALIEWVVIWGKAFDQALLQAWGVCEEVASSQLLASLCQRHLLEENAASSFQLTHEPLREVVHTSMTSDRRIALHLQIAHGLTAHPPEESLWSLADLAHHWQQGGQLEDARAAYWQAAQEALARVSLSEAEALLSAYIELSSALDQPLLEAKVALAMDVYAAQGQRALAQQLLEEVVVATAQLGLEQLQARARLHLGFVLHGLGMIQEANDSLVESLAYYVRYEQLEGQAKALRHLGVMCAQQGRYQEATAHFSQSLSLWDQLGDVAEQGLLLNNLGSIYFEQSQNQIAETYYTQALSLFCGDAHRSIQGKLLNNLSMVSLEQGRFAEATTFAERSLAMRRALGDRTGEGYVLNNLAFLAYRQRDYPKAYVVVSEALALWRSIRHPRGEGYALTNLGAICRDIGDEQAAQTHLDEALKIATDLQNPHMEGHVHLYLAVSHRYNSAWAQARASLAQALALFADEQVGQHICCLAEAGFLDLAEGTDSRASYQRARALAEAGTLATGGEWFEALDAWQRAVHAFAIQRPLLYGQVPEDIPAPRRA